MKIKKLLSALFLTSFLTFVVSTGINSGNAEEKTSVSTKVTQTLSNIAKGLKEEGEEKRKQFREDDREKLLIEKEEKQQSSKPEKVLRPSKEKASKHQ